MIDDKEHKWLLSLHDLAEAAIRDRTRYVHYIYFKYDKDKNKDKFDLETGSFKEESNGE